MDPVIDPDMEAIIEAVIEAEGLGLEGVPEVVGASRCAARSRLVPNNPALRPPKHDVATQRLKIIAPVVPNNRDPKS